MPDHRLQIYKLLITNRFPTSSLWPFAVKCFVGMPDGNQRVDDFENSKKDPADCEARDHRPDRESSPIVFVEIPEGDDGVGQRDRADDEQAHIQNDCLEERLIGVRF